MSITVANTGTSLAASVIAADTAAASAAGNAAATIWSSLEASTSGSQSALTTNALLAGPSGVGTSGNLTPVIASAQATLDSIVANPTLNLSRVLTSPSFAVLVSALDGSAGNANGLGNNGLGNNGIGDYGLGSGSTGVGSASDASIGSAAKNSSGAMGESAGSAAYFSRLLAELDSIRKTPTSESGAAGLLGGASNGSGWSAGQTTTQLAVA